MANLLKASPMFSLFNSYINLNINEDSILKDLPYKKLKKRLNFLLLLLMPNNDHSQHVEEFSIDGMGGIAY